MDYMEISAKTVDDAITKACIEIGTSSDNLDIKVISEGSSGFLGFGSKPAIIRVCKKTVQDITMEEVKEVKEVKKPVKTEKTNKPKTANETTGGVKKETRSPGEFQREVVVRTEEEIEEIKVCAKSFLMDVFSAMSIQAELVMEYDNRGGNLNIDISGEDMGILIGKRGQTLDSLQYIVGLVINKGREGHVRVKLDTENYRSRRKDTLENLARNIAYRVRKTRKAVSLEPMNPYERRIIHSSLQSNRYVETYSEGNEPYRHVVITLKK